MSRLSKLKTEVTMLKRATGVDAKGTPDNFTNLSAAVATGSSNDRTQEQIYGSYSYEELKWACGPNVQSWPLWAKQKFQVV